MSKQCFIDLKLMIMALRYHLCTISAPSAALAALVLVLMLLVKLVPYGEIVINPGDLKHVVELV